MYQKKCWKIHVIFLLLLSMLLLNACHMPAGSEKTEENIMDERENSEESSIWISINDIPKGYTEIRYVSVPMRQQDCYSNAEGNKRFVVEVQQGDTDLISVEEKRKIEIDGSQGTQFIYNGENIKYNGNEKEQIQEIAKIKKGERVLEWNAGKYCWHRYPTESERNELINASYKILCGTNILSGKMRNYGLWKLNEDISIYKNTILMGVGFDSECEIYDLYTKRMLKTILAPDAIHSVRDRFSERMLKKMGIKNVVYTGCPTMWELTPDLCKKIPHKKGKNVVCTLTDYNREMKVDQYMLNVLSDSYENVWIWPQGIEDEQYISQLKVNGNVSIIEYGMKSFDDIMQKAELDYVGTRLHAGIHALRHMHRTIVIAVDNRARNIGTDTGLPVIERSEIEDKLKIKIYSEFQTEIKLPVSNINYWKKSSEKLMRKC